MINSKIISLFEQHNINKIQGIAYLLCLYYNDNNIEWIPVETRSLVKLLGIVTIDKGIPVFAYNLFENLPNNIKEANISDSELLIFVRDKYLPLWPMGLKNLIGYDVHGNTTDCILKMSKFIKSFNNVFKVNYSKTEIFNTILSATSSYLAHKRIENYNMCKKSNNFISDDKGSILENFVLKTINKELTDIDKLMTFTSEM